RSSWTDVVFCTAVHCPTMFVPLLGFETMSFGPCQTDRIGQGGSRGGEAALTASASSFVVIVTPTDWHPGTWIADVAQPNGTPPITPPPAKTSGSVASITSVMLPPDDRPVT